MEEEGRDFCDYGSCIHFLRRFLVERNGGNSNVNSRIWDLYENSRNDKDRRAISRTILIRTMIM